MGRSAAFAETLRRRASGGRVILVVYLLLLPLLRPVVSVLDPVGYYAWARSVLIDHSLDVTDEFAHYQMPPGNPHTPTGYLHNQWAAGSALTWLPAMELAHSGVLTADALGAGVAADGYSWPYVLAAALTSSAAGLAAVWLCRRLARQYFGDFAATAATLTVWLATPFVFFQFIQPFMAHATDALLNTLCIALWVQARRMPSAALWAFGLGAAVSAAVWVRSQNGVWLPVLALDLAIVLLAAVRRGGVPAVWPVIRERVLPLAAGLLLLALPLLLFWHAVYGAWILNTYVATSGGTFDWTAPHLLDLLLSSNHGLFTWAPVTVPALAGLCCLWQTDRRLTVLLAALAAANGYVIAAWSVWFGGDTPGPRLLLAILPVFVLGLAALLNRARNGQRAVAALLALALVGWNVLLIAQYMLGMVAPSGEVDMWVLAQNQAAVIPRLLGMLLRR